MVLTHHLLINEFIYIGTHFYICFLQGERDLNVGVIRLAVIKHVTNTLTQGSYVGVRIRTMLHSSIIPWESLLLEMVFLVRRYFINLLKELNWISLNPI